ncbi:MAG: hypothetical protein ACP5HU_10245 [Phycisphaerae bacterium]
MIPTREGLFNAYPVEVGIDETGPNNLTTCIIRFQLYEELQPSGEWADCSHENLDITGYFYIEKRDGDLNGMVVHALKAALGWDGRDVFWLQQTDLSEHPVQVKLGFEEYDGRARLKVQFLNPYGSTGGGGVTRAEGSTRQAIVNRLGPKLRALAGPGSPSKPKPTPAKRPPARPKPSAPPPSPPKPEPRECTMEQAWEAFAGQCDPDRWDREAIEAEWFRVLAELFPGKQPDELTPAEWATMRDQGPSRIVPF